MALREELESSGIWLFRWRSYLPLFFFAIIILTMRGFKYPGQSETLDALWEGFCFIICFIGLGIRVYTIGHTPRGTSGRNTKTQVAESLNTSGIYSVVRHPLYLGNFFMGLGIVLFARVWSVTIIYTLVFWIYYERIMYAEEAFLREKFGKQFIEWANLTNAFIPNFKTWKQPSIPFSLKNVFKREYNGFFAVIISLFALETIGDYFVKGKIEFDFTWRIILIFGIVVWLVLLFLKKKTKLLHVAGR